MLITGAVKPIHFSFYFSSFTLAVSFTVISCHSTKCRQSPCYLPPVHPSTLGLKKFTHHASTSNDLNPLINNQLTHVYSPAQNEEHQILNTSIKHKNIPNYMLDIYSQKSHKLATGNSYENVRNYRAFSGTN
jgi:hypothetical protein